MVHASAGFLPSLGLIPALVLGMCALCAGAFIIGRQSLTLAYQSVGVGAATFAASFAVLNVALQLDQIDRQFWADEIAHGRLALRVTSVVFLVPFIQILRDMLKDTALPPPDHPYPTVRKYDWEERHKGWPLTSVAEHANVFAIALAMIWSFTLNGKTTLVIALLNWIFAFISDDFLIAASYRRKLGVTPPSFDAWRINLGSLGLVVLMVVASTMEYPRWATWAMVSVILIFRIIAPNFHRIRETGAETMELWGVYVGDELYILNSELLRRAVIDRDSEIVRRIRDAHEAGVEVDELSAISGYSADRVTEIVQSDKEDC